MSKIRGVNTSPELKLRKELWSSGLRYRINYKKIAGKPDIAIVKHKIAIFIDGEFWHGYNWQEKKKKIKSNRKYWIKKIEGNMKRDIENNEKLKEQGWIVMRFWEKEIKNDIDKCIEQIYNKIG